MTEPTLNPATFDLDSWLEGVKPLRQTCTLYADGTSMGRVNEIVLEMATLKPQSSGDSSMGDKPRIEVLRDELRDVWATVEASGVTFELQQPPSDDVESVTRTVNAAVPLPVGEDRANADLQSLFDQRNQMFGTELAHLAIVGAVRPDGSRNTPTPAQIDKLRKKFGQPEMERLNTAISEIALSGQVTAPFSQAVSAILAETASD